MRRREARLRQAVAVVIAAELGRLGDRLNARQLTAKRRRLERMLAQFDSDEDQGNRFRLWLCIIGSIVLGAGAPQARIDTWIESRVSAIKREARQKKIDGQLLKQIRPGKPLPPGLRYARTDGSEILIVTNDGRPIWSRFS